ncbi:MAG: SDR family oxidoreductase [bacterium]
MRNLQNKVVAITGATGGMGRAVARRFGLAGAKICLLDLDEKTIEAFRKELEKQSIEAYDYLCDVTSRETCDAAIGAVLNKFGRIDILINNAGITHRSAFLQTEAEVFRKVMDVNFFGALHCAQAALPALVESRGLIIVMSSICGFSPLYGRTGYAASKHALHGLFESLRTELSDQGVHVMMVCPGFTDTGITKHALDGDGSLTSHPRSSTGKIASPQDVAETIYRGAVSNKRLLVLSKVGKLAYFLSKISPAFYEKIMANKLRQELQR